MSRIFPEPVKFHKKSSQLQIHLKKPFTTQADEIVRGCLFFEIARAIPDSDKMDWANKINMKIGVTDIGKIIAGLKAREEIKIFHENSAGSSTLNISEGQPGTYSFMFSRKAGESINRASIYLNKEDMNVFLLLLTNGLLPMLGWQ